ncbi:hypothetical protein CZ787_14225 [Halomonas citrativorans]|uniref:DUF2730 family protein n=1 Tax=Halomonas citrativorans TaxID=2742612 RepID=A0A1R4I3S4_9GAMM|nr:DUF2730 family protein [Halomonas citrativorans]SJN14254.1 hypothetical protein CZ787_14225 [Halomonas citrativorans]
MEPINWAAAKVLFDVLQAAFMGVMAAYIYWLNKHRASQTAIRSTNKRIDNVEKQVVKLEHTVERLPDHGDLTKLQEQMSQTNVLLAEISASQKATAQQVGRMNDYLLNRSGGKV